MCCAQLPVPDLRRSTEHLEETHRTMPPPRLPSPHLPGPQPSPSHLATRRRSRRPLLAAATAFVLAVGAFSGHAIATAPAGVSQATGAANRTALASVEHRDAEKAARDAAVRAASQQAAQARAQRAQAAARAAARKAAQVKLAKAKAQARARAQARAKAAAEATARAKAAKQRAARSAAGTRTAAARARTSWPALNRAIAQIPGYRDGIARWHVTSRYGHYGITDANQPGAANIYISPTVPLNKLYSVAAHEYGHAVVIANYGTGYGPYTEYSRDMVSWFGGDRVTGLERAADCIALRLGATWTNYTGCGDAHWQEGARILLRGGKL